MQDACRLRIGWCGPSLQNSADKQRHPGVLNNDGGADVVIALCSVSLLTLQH